MEEDKKDGQLAKEYGSTFREVNMDAYDDYVEREVAIIKEETKNES